MDPISAPSPPDTGRTARIRTAAEAVEASFLAEMLKSAGFGAAREAMGGGVGEDQFTSFLVEAQAKEMVASGGIGLSEALFDVISGRMDEQ